MKQSWSNRESRSNHVAIMKQSWSNNEAIPTFVITQTHTHGFTPSMKQSWSDREAIMKQSWSTYEALMKHLWRIHEATPFYFLVTPIVKQFVPSWLLKPIHMGLHQPWSTSKCGTKASAFPPLFFCGWVIVPAKYTPIPYLWYKHWVLVPKKRRAFWQY